MVPKTRAQEHEHRKRKRQMEMDIIIETITSLLSETIIAVWPFGIAANFYVNVQNKFLFQRAIRDEKTNLSCLLFMPASVGERASGEKKIFPWTAEFADLRTQNKALPRITRDKFMTTGQVGGCRCNVVHRTWKS